MNDYDYPGTGPCADYEFEIAEWLDGELSPERARIISLHVGTCVRCRAWRESYAAIDARLAASLPRPALSSDFAARVAGSIDSLSRLDSSARAAIEHEYLRVARASASWVAPAGGAQRTRRGHGRVLRARAAALGGRAVADAGVCRWVTRDLFRVPGAGRHRAGRGSRVVSSAQRGRLVPVLALTDTSERSGSYSVRTSG